MTSFDVFKLSIYYSWAGSIIIAISCLLLYNSRPHYIRALGFYALSSIVFSFGQSMVPIEHQRTWNNPIGNGFVLFEAFLLGSLYYFVTHSNSFRKSVLASITFYIFFYAFVFLFFAEYSFSYIRFGRDLLMILYSIAYFYYLIRALPEENLLRFPMFWINAAIIFFFSGMFILSFFRDYIVTVLKDDTSGFWAFRNFFRFAFCIVLAYAGWLDWRSIKSKAATQ